MSSLSSTVTPSSKPCTLEMKDNEISQIIELFNNDLVHVVDISVSLSNISHGKDVLSDFHVQIMNPIGREILFALDKHKTFQWTSTVGIRDFELHLLESQNGCIINNTTNITEFTVETVKNIVRRINLATKYDIWYSFKDVTSGEELKDCCQITKLNLLECNHDCSESNSYLFRSSFLWESLYYILFSVVLLCFASCLFHFQSHADFDVEFAKYYKLEESRMSPSFILFKIIWEENSRIIACIRVCALAISILMYLSSETSYISIYFLAFICFSVATHVIFLFLSGESTTPTREELNDFKDIRVQIAWHCHCKFLELCGYDAAELRQELRRCESSVMIKMLTLLCNIKFWRKTSETVKEKIEKHVKSDNRALKFLTVCLCYTFSLFIYFFSVITLPFSSIFVAFICLLYSKLFVVSQGSNLLCLFLVAPPFSLLIFVIILIPRAIVSLLFGLFLNLIFFIPYLAFFSVLTFYCISYWKSMEENYLLLKQLIYEACRDIKHDDNDLEPNKQPERNDKVLPVVSKELYDKIREKLLPYDENLFCLAIKLLCAFAFSFIIFQLIIMVREFEVSGFVQVLTTASLGVMPHILNVATMKTSEQTKEAWKEKMKLNVKHMVEHLVRDDSKLAQTKVIIEWLDYTTEITNEMTDDNHGVFKTFFKLCRKRKRRLQEHDTTSEMTDDNDQVNEERVELPQTEIMIQEHDTTNEMTDDNDQVNEECVEPPQTEVMKDHKHDPADEMIDDNDGLFGRFFKLFRKKRYPECGKTNDSMELV